MKTKVQFVLFFALVLIAVYSIDSKSVAAASVQQTVPAELTYGFVQDPDDPQRLIAVVHSNVTSDNVAVSTATFALLLPADTVTNPPIPVAPATGSFVNINGSWAVKKVTPSLYASIGFNAADLEGYDLYQLVLSPGSTNPSLRADQPLHLFSFHLPENCTGSTVQVLENDSTIQKTLGANLGANFNNQMSVSINDAPASNLYVGNNVNGSAISCPLTASESVTHFFLPFVKK